MNRTRVEFEITHAGETTPQKIKVKKVISAKTGTDESLIVIDQIKSSFGMGKSTGVAFAYKDKNSMEKIEQKHMIKRNEVKEENKEAEKSAEASAAEAPKEEKPAEQTAKPSEEKSTEETKAE